MEHFLIILGTFGYCVASAVIPIFHAEAYLVAASLLVPPELRWPLVIASTTGQMIGKTAMYFGGRGVLLIPGQRMQRRI
jgi:membrane protein YqaA with SNARE-associated domain